MNTGQRAEVPDDVAAAYDDLQVALTAAGRVPCRESTAPAGWFTKAGEPDAVELCGSCPARVACGAYAVAAREEWGVWGGLTEADRRALRRGAA